MRKSFLLLVAAAATVGTVGSTIMVQADTRETVSQTCNIKNYVVSGTKGDCNNEWENILSNLKVNTENCTVNNCPIIVYPETCKPDTNVSGNCQPETNVSDNCQPETEVPSTNIPETSVPVTNIPETETSDTNRPDVNIPETESTVNHETTTVQGSNSSFAQQVVDLVNVQRQKAGLGKVTLDKDIEKAALVRAKEIEVSFSHTRPNGSTFSSVLKENNISYRGAGENIAWGQASPEAVMEAWMNSEGHRANILNSSFTKLGVGYYQNSSGRNHWVQLFTY